MKKVIIEFYDPDFLENIASLFGEAFDRIVYICPKEEGEDPEQARITLTNFIYHRFHIRPEFVHLAGHPMCAVLDRLDALTGEEAAYTFDITGGSPEFIAAAGFFAARHPEKTIAIRQYDPERGTLRFTYPAEAAAETRLLLPLTLQDIISLSGSSLHSRRDTIRYDLDSGSLYRDISTLWTAVRDAMRSWNSFAILPDAGEGRTDGLYAKQAHPGAVRHFEEISRRLCAVGMMSDVTIRQHSRGATVFYRLHIDPKSRFLFEKGGNLMEMVCYLTAMESGAFGDCCVGVELDWDKSQRDTYAAPYNEVDLLLLHGHTPIFASCKSTEAENDHLYEIAVMARHYGGAYARPVLLSGAKNTPVIRNRAREMGILLLDDICSKSIDELIACWRLLFP